MTVSCSSKDSAIATGHNIDGRSHDVDWQYVSFVCFSWFQKKLLMRLATSSHIIPMTLGGSICQKGLSYLSHLELQKML